MIRENQKILNFINVISDGLILLLALPIAFWLRFYVLPGGIINVKLVEYLLLDFILMLVHIFIYSA